MSEFFHFIMENPWQAVVAAASGLAAFGATVKIIGVIIDLFGRAKKRLNKRLAQLEQLTQKVLMVADNLGIDIVRTNVEKAQAQIDKVADKLSKVERMEQTLTSVLAFIETVKIQWDAKTRVEFEQIKDRLLSTTLEKTPNFTPITETEQSTEPVALSQAVAIDDGKRGKKSKRKLKLKDREGE